MESPLVGAIKDEVSLLAFRRDWHCLGNTNADREFLAGCTARDSRRALLRARSVVGADMVSAGAEASIVKQSWGVYQLAEPP
jgi:hypothetical protein